MDFAIPLNPDAPLPMYRQIYEGLRHKILAGKLAPGQRVPSTRSLSEYLKVSRNTVAQSYAQLLSEGYFQAIVGSGTFVCRQIPADLSEATLPQPTQLPHQHNRSLSTYGESLVDFNPFVPPDPSAAISFRYGRPALDEFPQAIWRQLLSRHCRSQRDALDYNPDLLGHRPLRQAIADYLERSRQVCCHPDCIAIVSGSQQAIDLTARIFINRGDTVAIENPGYLGAKQAFAAQGASLCPISVDELGIVVEELPKFALSPTKLIYVTPSHQFPTGAVMSLSRRLELLTWAQARGALIIEDDYDSEYRYGERPIPALKELDRNDAVLYMGTFSKVLFPALRIGYLVLPPDLVDVFCHAKWLADRQSPLLEQYVLTDFIAEGHLERHIRRMRNLYDRRRQALVQALSKYFARQASIMGENAGMHVMMQLNLLLSDEEILARAVQVGVGITNASPYYLKNSCRGQFILGYTELNESQIEEGIYRLSKVLKV
ncbi:MAG: HTH-type transcriptional regulatory protein GabR [Chroococcidiopsis cubana SAG 39.79]|uniref:GntR family transcriptional regulator n=1 Tax=Chroococcidiopsis cubana SAG 39.79 TaxID=388085 RepID=A0AB37UFB6_9CYAN|nr:PLP-dependent aminotransferase family protein [Chroococcidiopsis cubana]MDZ4872270.1 HTH-type transcriptional regulatory protein GabR [Chroococcidiopsis cubana SAG 39.79]PSB54941.1 PLP-dependent aminotransferase family protein [Chroococcidiopsis cubana CCALA 043]RUT07414.1 GntR family transcriptional regulator [Chroococcidiopsis cubana SAG 39.79]